MTERFESHLCCGHRGFALLGGAREPFVLPGTERRYAPDRAVDVVHTRLEVALDPAEDLVRGTVRHDVVALADAVATVPLHAKELTILAVRDGKGRPLAFRHEGESVHVSLPEPLPFEGRASVALDYRGTPRRGLYFVRPDEHYPEKPLQAWTQGQDEDSRHWFPCFDHPCEKATVEVLARVPARFTTLGNGALVGRQDHGDGTVTWHWRQALPHAPYLTTLVVGEFDEVRLPGHRVPLTAYVPKGRRADGERAFARTADMVRAYEERFGVPYPYEKYAQVVVHDFIFGGMENTTATTLTEYAVYDERAGLDYDVDDLIAHELAHQWWGDLVTCRDWSHAWLNEGFATWSENVIREALKGEEEAVHGRHETLQAYLHEDGGRYRRAIVDRRFEEPIDLFDRHLYEKGSWVVHMLRQELGDGPFWRAIRAYLDEHREGTVVTDDLRRSIERATGRNLEWFFDQWVHRGGHPEVTFSWSYDEKKRLLVVKVDQGQTADDVTPEAFRLTVEVDVATGQGSTTHRLEATRRQHAFAIPLDEAPKSVTFDPRGHLLAAVKLDRPASEHQAVLGSDAPLMARLRAASALAEDASAATVAALGKALSDPFWGLAAEAAGSLARVRTPAARDALVGALRSVAHPKARRAIARALGAFRHDAVAAEALRERLERGDPSLFVESSAAEALGRTRAGFAREALEKALRTKESWSDQIRVGCAAGLGALADEGALPALRAAFARGKAPRLRTASAGALAALGRRLASRDEVREVLEEGLLDPDFRVVMASIAAVAALGEPRSSAALSALADRSGTDGRVRRAAREALRTLGRAGGKTPEVSRLADEVEGLKKRMQEVLGRLDAIETRAVPPSQAPREDRLAT
jgi:aminopeptidase N